MRRVHLSDFRPRVILVAKGRFWKRVDCSSETGCWPWSGCTRDDGYGRFSLGGKTIYAHRFAYEVMVGPAPEMLDHACLNPNCVRPDPKHVRPATSKQNQENLKRLSHGRVGIRGVTWSKELRMFKGSVGHNRKLYHVGYFHDLHEAEQAVITKRNELFTHNEVDQGMT